MSTRKVNARERGYRQKDALAALPLLLSHLAIAPEEAAQAIGLEPDTFKHILKLDKLPEADPRLSLTDDQFVALSLWLGTKAGLAEGFSNPATMIAHTRAFAPPALADAWADYPTEEAYRAERAELAELPQITAAIKQLMDKLYRQKGLWRDTLLEGTGIEPFELNILLSDKFSSMNTSVTSGRERLQNLRLIGTAMLPHLPPGDESQPLFTRLIAAAQAPDPVPEPPPAKPPRPIAERIIAERTAPQEPTREPTTATPPEKPNNYFVQRPRHIRQNHIQSDARQAVMVILTHLAPDDASLTKEINALARRFDLTPSYFRQKLASGVSLSPRNEAFMLGEGAPSTKSKFVATFTPEEFIELAHILGRRIGLPKGFPSVPAMIEHAQQLAPDNPWDHVGYTNAAQAEAERGIVEQFQSYRRAGRIVMEHHGLSGKALAGTGLISKARIGSLFSVEYLAFSDHTKVTTAHDLAAAIAAKVTLPPPGGPEGLLTYARQLQPAAFPEFSPLPAMPAATQEAQPEPKPEPESILDIPEPDEETTRWVEKHLDLAERTTGPRPAQRGHRFPPSDTPRGRG